MNWRCIEGSFLLDKELTVSEKTRKDFFTYHQVKNKETIKSKIIELEFERNFRIIFPASQRYLIWNGGQTVSTSVTRDGVDLR